MANIFTHPLHLGLGARAVTQPEMTGGMDWYAAYSARNAADGREGRLVMAYRFAENWDSWEMHPAGDEVVLCTEGRIRLHQEFADGTTAVATIGPGDYAINPPGCWHTADVAGDGPAAALFITAGEGTQHRPR